MKNRTKILLLALICMAPSCPDRESKTVRSLNLEECYEKNLAHSTLLTGWYYISDIDNGFVRQLDNTDEFYTMNPFPILTAEDITTLSIETNSREEMYLFMKFGKAGTELWRAATRKSIGEKLAFIVNDKLVGIPQVHAEITAGVSTLGRMDYSKEDYEKVKQAIENNKTEIKKNK